MDSDYELQLVALGLCLASPKLLALVDRECFHDSEISRLITSLKETALGERRLSNADQWFAKRKVDISGSVSESILESVRKYARFKRAVKLAHEMALGGKTFSRDEYIDRLKKEAEKL